MSEGVLGEIMDIFYLRREGSLAWVWLVVAFLGAVYYIYYSKIVKYKPASS
jgi:hypothetical protein